MSRSKRLALLIPLSILCLIGAGGCSKDKGTNPTPVVTRELDSATIAGGGTYPHTFASVGTFGYHCTIHSGMTGSVTVATGQPATATVDIQGSSFSPSTISVAPGGTVTWTNVSGLNHTVTSH